MNCKLKNTIKKIVNKYHLCSKCKDRNDCKFWKGENTAFDCGECTADEFAEGVFETLHYLSHMPWNGAMDAIVSAGEEGER